MSAESRVFVVDDDVASAASMSALMKSEGLKTESYVSAEAFLDAYDGRPNACLVVDVRLPCMNGLELQQALNERGHKISIVMISGHADREVSDRALENGAVAFLEKPFPANDLCKSVRAALSRN